MPMSINALIAKPRSFINGERAAVDSGIVANLVNEHLMALPELN